MLVCKEHQHIKSFHNDLSYVYDLINSKDNKSMLMQYLMNLYTERLANSEDNVLSSLLTALDESCEKYDSFFVPNRKYYTNLHYLSDINQSILNNVVSKIPKHRIVHDYLYSQKGPGFKDELIGNNRHPLLQMGEYGPVTNIKLPRNQLGYVQRHRIRPELLK